MDEKVSILIHNRDRAVLVGRCLDSITQLSYRPLEVVVLDAGSTDGSQEVIERGLAALGDRGIEGKMVSVPMKGVAGSRNLAAAEATGELLFFFDNDAIVAPTSDLGAVVRRLREESGLAVVSFRVLYHDTDQVDPGCWIFHRPQAAWSARAFETFTFTGGACCMPAALFREVGGFWEHCVYGREEEDMSLAFFGRGMHLVYDPTVTIRHYPGIRPSSALSKRRFNELRNGVLVFWRRLPVPLACLLIAMRICTMLFRAALKEKTGIVSLWKALGVAVADWRAGAGRRKPISYAAAMRYVRKLYGAAA
jgi:GT2 family glycosyltransferase